MSHASSTPQAYDFTLTIGATTYGYMLYVDPQTGQKHWNEGLAPLLTPQQRVTEFSYEHIPPEIDVPAAFENWFEGAGVVDHSSVPSLSVLQPSTGNAPRSYNYSQGIDLSWGNRAYQSPARQADNASTGGAIAAAPVKFWYSYTFGLWCLASTTLYKYDVSSGTWVSKDTASGAYTSAAELNGVMYVSISGYAYHYSTDGTTWTTATLGGSLTDDKADLFVVRNNGLWAMRLESLYTTTNGQNGGVNWGAPTVVGSSSELTNSMVTANTDIWIFKREGIYNFDGTTVTQVYTPTLIDSSNGKYAYVHSDGRIYVVYENSIMSIDPFGTTLSPIAQVFPQHVSNELKGTISQISGNFTDLFFTLTNPSSRTYLIKLNPDNGVFHTIAYLGSNANAACLYVTSGVMSSTNPSIATGYGIAAVHFDMPRANLRPEDDIYYTYDTSSGTVYGPWLAYGARAFDKFLNRGSVLARNATAGQVVALGYQLDDETTTTTLVSAVDSGLTEESVDTEVAFNRLRYVITMNAASESQSPILVAATLHATLNPPRHRMWKPIVLIEPNLVLNDGNIDTQDAHIAHEALFHGANRRVSMIDRNNVSYVIRVLDIQEMGMKSSNLGGDERDQTILQLSLAEISPLEGHLLTARYGDDNYGSGREYS